MKHYTCFVLVTLILMASLGASASTLVSQNLGAGAYSSCAAFPGQLPEWAFDGDLETSYIANNPWDFVQVDLGQTILLDRACMYSFQAGLERTVEIYISDTTMIVEGEPVVGAPVYSENVIIPALPDPMSFEFAAGTTARYVAFNGLNTNWNDWLACTEFQVYGDVVPEPSGLVALMAGAIGVFGYVRRRK